VVWEGRSREAPPYPDQLSITEQVDALDFFNSNCLDRAMLAAHVSRVGPQRRTRGARAIPICSPRLSMAETGAVAAASSKRNSALL
jgi:hypothetical protein